MLGASSFLGNLYLLFPKIYLIDYDTAAKCWDANSSIPGNISTILQILVAYMM